MRETRLRAAMVRNHLDIVVREAEQGLSNLQFPLRARKATTPLLLIGQRMLEQVGLHNQIQPLPKLPRPLPELQDAQLRQAAKFVGYLAHAELHLGEHNGVSLQEQLISAATTKGYSGEIAFAYAVAAIAALQNGLPQRAQRLAVQARVIAEQFPQHAFSVRAITTVSGLVDPWFGNFDQTLRGLLEGAAKSMALQDYEEAQNWSAQR